MFQVVYFEWTLNVVSDDKILVLPGNSQSIGNNMYSPTGWQLVAGGCLLELGKFALPRSSIVCMVGTDLSHSPYQLLTGRYSNCEDCDANWKQRPLKIKVCTFSNVLISVFTLKANVLQLGISVQTMGDCSNLQATKAITRRFFLSADL